MTLLSTAVAPQTRAARAHPYASLFYGRALGHIGRCMPVAAWDSFVLARTLPGGEGEDAIGAYPLMHFGGDIDAGLSALAKEGLVSFVCVPDPLCSPARPVLAAAFDLCRPFKAHYLIDDARAFSPSAHHQARIRRGQRRCQVREVDLLDHLSTWTALYSDLSARRAIGGAAAFADSYFEALAHIETMTAFAAFVEGEIVAMTIWFAHDGVVYNHLTASNRAGYANGAAYALYAAAIERFRGDGVINLGGGAGHGGDPNDGLAAFKRGFSNGEVEALICGAVLDRPRYDALAAGRAGAFFPLYRG